MKRRVDGSRPQGAVWPLVLLAAGLLGAGAPFVASTAAPSPYPAPAAPDTARETVVLLHGLGRTERSMVALERSLESAGFRAVNLGYPSRTRTVAELVDTVAAELDACCAGDTLHFVTHSLGGILVRVYGATHGSDRIGRVVMLSPPNQGSEVVDQLPDELLRLVLGPAALELGTGRGSVTGWLPPVDFELGIITGESTLNPLFSLWLPGEDDGKVSVASARIEGAEDFLVVPYTHTFIMQRERVIEQVLAFLRSGRFSDDAG